MSASIDAPRPTGGTPPAALPAAMLVLFAMALPAAQAQQIGRPATRAEIAILDRDVRGDGQGLPEGAGSVAAGERLYERKCAACHGDFGEGAGRMPALTGGEGSLNTDRPRRTIGSYWPFAPTIFDYLTRAMPFGHAATLSANEAYALTAFVLNLNDIVGGDFIASAKTLPGVMMPNREGFTTAPRPRSPATRCMRACRKPPRVIARAARKEGRP